VLGFVALSVELHKYVAVCTCCVEIIIGADGVGAIVGTGVGTGVGAIVGTGVGTGVGAIVGTGVGTGVGAGVKTGAAVGAIVGAVLGELVGAPDGTGDGEDDGPGDAVAGGAAEIAVLAKNAVEFDPGPVTVTCCPVAMLPVIDVAETIAIGSAVPP
jgi:hypothetical protein